MPIKITARVRLTHKYISAYRHLDKFGRRFSFKMLGGRQVEAGNGFDSLGSFRHRVIGSKTESQEQQAQALREKLSFHGCTHEHDCCGCVSTYARVTKVKPGVFSVLLTKTANY